MNRILLVEDDSGAQLLYRNRLTDLGYDVVGSTTGAMGLMEARAAPFDLFLVDIELGSGIDGYEVCRRLKTIPEIHGVPVVLISGQVKSQEDLHRGYEAGCQSFLVKGDLMLLEDIVRAMLRIKSLSDDLAMQNRLLEERNRRLEAEQARNADLSRALSSRPLPAARELGRPDALLLVDGEGVVRSSDRGARDLFGQVVDGKHLALLAPDSRLEAVARNARTEPHESIRFESPERLGRSARQLIASVHPFVPHPERAEPALRAVLLYDATRQRPTGEPSRRSESSAQRREWAPLVEAARETWRPAALLGTSAAVRDLRARLARAANGEEPALLVGPAGSGKGFAARTLHYSGVRPGPFVALSCGAFGADALEHELFGDGAPDARAEHGGAFHAAHGGTLFLQDVERLPLPLQQRLLDALTEARSPRAGAPAVERPDVRLVAATRVRIERAVEQGQFLRELARRLSAHTLTLTALRERPEDIGPLARHFLARHSTFEDARFSAHAAWLLEQHDWPDNVRELERTVQDACGTAAGPEVDVEDLPRPFLDLLRRLEQRGVRPHAPPAKDGAVAAGLLEALEATGSLLDAYEKQALLHALRLKQGDKLAAAKLLDVGKSTFYRKLKQHGIR